MVSAIFYLKSRVKASFCYVCLNLIFIYLLFLLPTNIWAQSIQRFVVASTGAFQQNSQVQYSFTVGEPVATYFLGSSNHLTQGFQQGEALPLPLPLELLSFEAKRINPDAAKLTWTIAQVEQGAYFVLERKDAKGQFRTITTIKIEDNATIYNFQDANIGETETYYRLRVVDRTDAFSYSPIRSLPALLSAFTASLSPNPAYNSLTIHLVSKIEAIVKVQILDLSGRSLLEKTFPTNQSDFSMDGLEKLVPGAYFLKIQQGNTTENLTFVKL